MNLRWHCFYRSSEKGSGNRYRAKCVHCEKMLDGTPDKLEIHIQLLDSGSRVEYMRIVEQFSKKRRVSTHTSIRSQLGFEAEQMIS